LADRIALFFGNFSGGGVQRVRLVLAREFIARGLDVDLVVVNGVGELRSAVPEKANIVDLRAKRTLFALPALVRYFRTVKPKAILSSQTHHNVLAIIARKLSGISTRLVVGEHHNLHENRKDEGLPAVLHLMVARIFYAGADVILAVSWGVAESIREALSFPESRIRVINNPIVITELMEKSKEQVDHHWLSQPEIPVIIGMGRLTSQKDFPTLLKALKILNHTQPARLLILGEGEDKDNLQSLIAQLQLNDVVQLLGFVSNPYPYLKRADLFVLSSLWEGFPNVLLEALACGTSVVATDCPNGPSEMLENGKYGPLVPIGDPESMAKAIEDVLDNPIQSDVLMRRAADFSVEIIGEQYVDLLLGNPYQKRN
jgi:glycosyltransferase involved in cell wall biosynthesis